MDNVSLKATKLFNISEDRGNEILDILVSIADSTEDPSDFEETFKKIAEYTAGYIMQERKFILFILGVIFSRYHEQFK
jgi:hypothetical protein